VVSVCAWKALLTCCWRRLFVVRKAVLMSSWSNTRYSRVQPQLDQGCFSSQITSGANRKYAMLSTASPTAYTTVELQVIQYITLFTPGWGLGVCKHPA
jgi:hypothetical protein